MRTSRHGLCALANVLLSLTALPALAFAQDAAPANTLADMSRQFSACMNRNPVGPAGSQMTIAFAMRRDGSIFGKPRVTYSHFEGGAAQRDAFTAAVRQAIDACLPLKVTPALGAAIAGRIFTVTLGREAPGA